MEKAIEEFIRQRINDHEMQESENRELDNLYTLVKSTGSREIENATMLAEGELKSRYYRAGLRDAVKFILTWKEL